MYVCEQCPYNQCGLLGSPNKSGCIFTLFSNLVGFFGFFLLSQASASQRPRLLRLSQSLSKKASDMPIALNPFMYTWPNTTWPRKLYAGLKVRPRKSCATPLMASHRFSSFLVSFGIPQPSFARTFWPSAGMKRLDNKKRKVPLVCDGEVLHLEVTAI